jgi:DNA-binding response OmpR family regulator
MASSKIKILYVEDDPSLGFVVQDGLSAAGYTVHLCRDGKSALQQYNQQDYDICVLDVMLPKKDGFSLAIDIRKVNTKVPILFLTARGRIEDKKTGYETGADDYLTKPFEQQELLMKIKALLRRTSDVDKQTDHFQIGAYTYNPEVMKLVHAEEERRLTKTESKVLGLLCEHKNRVMERDLLLNLVWGKDDYQTGRSLDVYLSKLRKYLSRDARIRIENVHGVGFKLEIDE